MEKIKRSDVCITSSRFFSSIFENGVIESHSFPNKMLNKKKCIKKSSTFNFNTINPSLYKKCKEKLLSIISNIFAPIMQLFLTERVYGILIGYNFSLSAY